MIKRLIAYIPAALFYYWLFGNPGISPLGTVGGYFPTFINGIYMLPPLWPIFVFQLLFSLSIFDFSRNNFYRENLTKLIRHGKRHKVFWIATYENFICLLTLNIVLVVCSVLFANTAVNAKLLVHFTLQTLGIFAVILLQQILEIKCNSLIGMLVAVFGVMLMNQYRFVWIYYIHTGGFSGNIYLAIVIEILVIAIIWFIGALLVRRQEILE